jgi:hypothetical protein
MEKDCTYVYEKLKEIGVHHIIPRNFNIETDYYNKGIIKASDLKDGHYYLGKGRNCIYCKWDAKNKLMWHQRFKFGRYMIDNINYIDNDNGFDLFMAIEEVDEATVPKELRVDEFKR